MSAAALADRRLLVAENREVQGGEAILRSCARLGGIHLKDLAQALYPAKRRGIKDRELVIVREQQ